MPKHQRNPARSIDESAIMALIPSDRPDDFQHDISIRALWYLATAGALLIIHALSLVIVDFHATTELYVLLESVAVLLSAIVSSMALIKFRTRHLFKYLMIGFGFAAFSALNGLSILALVLSTSPLTAETALTYWVQGRLTLAVFMLASYIFWKYQQDRQQNKGILYGSLVAVPALLIGAHYFPGSISGVLVLTTAIAFLATAVGYITKGFWMKKYFEHYFVIALFIFSYTEFVRLSSTSIYDAPMVIAQLLFIAGTTATLAGLLMSMYIAFKQVEEAGNKINTILDSAGEGIVVLDRLARVILMNPKAEALIGVQSSTVSSDRLDSIVKISGEYDRHTLDHALQHALSKRTSISFDHQLLTRTDGKTIFVSYSVAPIIENGNTLLGLAVVIHDSSQEHELEQTKDNFLSVVAHQLRTPLGVMRWNLELLLADDFGKLTKKVRRPIEDSYQNNHRMVNLVNDLLNVLRIDQRRVVDNPTATDLYAWVKTICDAFRFEAHSRNISIKITQESKKPMPLVIDPERLTEIVENVVSNAIKYNKDNGTVTIALQSSKDSYIITVQDTGIGIPKKDRANIFTRFFRATNARTSNTGGSGLGLFVVQSYIRGWGGTVVLESVEHEGTTIRLSIPKKPRRLVASVLAKS